MDGRIDLKTFIAIVKRRVNTILWTTVCFALLTAGLSVFVIKKTYEAREYLIMRSQESEEIQKFNRELASSVDLIKSPIVLNEINKDALFAHETLKTLEDKIAVQNNKDSQIIIIAVRDKRPEYARALSEKVADTAKLKLNELLDVGINEKSSVSGAGSSVKTVGSTPVNIAIGIFAGLFFGLLLAMLKEHMDDSIQTIHDVENIFGMAVLGSVKLSYNVPDAAARNALTQPLQPMNRTQGGEVSV